MRFLGVWLTVLAVFSFALLATSTKEADQAEKSRLHKNASGGACSCTLDLAIKCLMAGDTGNRVEPVMAAFEELGGELKKLKNVSKDQLPEKLHHLQAIMEGKEGTHGVNLTSVLGSMKARVGDLHEENMKAQLHKARVLLDSSQLGEKPRYRRDTDNFLSQIKSYFWGKQEEPSLTEKIKDKMYDNYEKYLFEGRSGESVRREAELIEKVQKGHKENIQKIVDLLKKISSTDEDEALLLLQLSVAVAAFFFQARRALREQTFAPLEQGNQTS